jgi:hypothetical protein
MKNKKILSLYKGKGERLNYRNNIGCYVYKVRWYITSVREDNNEYGLFGRYKNKNGEYVDVPIETLFSGNFKECKEYLMKNGSDVIKERVKDITCKNKVVTFDDLYEF